MRDAMWDHAVCDEARVLTLARALHLHPVVARLLCLRGLDAPDDADRFLHPTLDHLHDPRQLVDLDVAVERLLTAIERQEPIVVHGDYDVDGVTSTVILRRALELIGARVSHFVPERLRDGYGLQPATLERLHAEGAGVVVSVDCGIRADEAADRARAVGLDLIITDHHEPNATLPSALAVVNPKRSDCSYPDKDLAGAGVALKIVQELCRRAGRTRWLPGFLKVAAIGTLADVVPLTGENRVIAKLGLDALSSGRHGVGLRALLDGAGLTGKRLDGFHVSYVLGPRINAAGRMSSPDLAARLLLIVDEGQMGEARVLAEQLNLENHRRQQEEADVLAQALRVVEADPGLDGRRVLVVGGEGWHRGVIGIVASRLVDRFSRPAIVLSIDGETAHGSCRSVPAFDMLEALDQCRDLFDRYGGHRQAAGLTMPAERLDLLRARLEAHAQDRLQAADLRPRLHIDAALGLRQIDERLLEGLAQIGPFGTRNPRPVFQAQGVEVARGPEIIKARHLRMSLRQDGRVLQAMAWRAAEAAPFFEAHRRAIDVAFAVAAREYRGERYVELEVLDGRVPMDAVAGIP